MTARTTQAALCAASVEAERRASAWDRFVRDYVGCVDDDPGDARKRYFAEIAEIEAKPTGPLPAHYARLGIARP